MEIIGKIKLIEETQTFDSGFEKKQVIIITDDKYPQEVALYFSNKDINLLDDFKAAQQVKVFYNIRGKEFNGRYFVNLQGWKIQLMDEVEQPQEEDMF